MRIYLVAFLIFLSAHANSNFAGFHERSVQRYEQTMQRYRDAITSFTNEIRGYEGFHFHPEFLCVSAMPDSSDECAVETDLVDVVMKRLREVQARTNDTLQGFVEPAQKAWEKVEKAVSENTHSTYRASLWSGVQKAFQKNDEALTTPAKVAAIEEISPDGSVPAAPILVVPGILGSVLEAKRQNATWLPSTCMRNTEWYKAWFDLQAIAFGFTCWSEVMSLKLFPDGTTRNKPGISVRAMPDSIKAVSCYNPSCTFTCDNTIYLQDFFRFLTSDMNQGVDPKYRKNQTKVVRNYELRKNLDSLPYDFRRSMRDMRSTLFPSLKARIERMYDENANQKVTILGHSMGGLHTNLFLNSFVDSAWKAKYIRCFIPVSVAYGGSVKALHSVLLGETQGWPLPFSWTRPLLETWAGLYAAFPRTNSTLWENEALVTVGEHAYYPKDIKNLLKDSGLKHIANAYDALNTEHAYDKAPGVETHCLFSTGYLTSQEILLDSFSSTDRDARRVREDFDGDGSVSKKSMEVCSQWKDKQDKPVQTTMYRGFEHMAFLAQNEPVWQQIFDIANFGLRAGEDDYLELRDDV